MMDTKSYSLPTPECPDTLSDETIIDWLESEIQNRFYHVTMTFDDPFYKLLDWTHELKILLALAAKYGRFYNHNEIWQLIGYHPVDNSERMQALEDYTDFWKSLVTPTQTQGED